jgi:hypothetical protein
MRDERFEVTVSFDEKGGYVAQPPRAADHHRAELGGPAPEG